MNSFNHYAYGAVLSWMYGSVPGGEPREHSAGTYEVSVASAVLP